MSTKTIAQLGILVILIILLLIIGGWYWGQEKPNQPNQPNQPSQPNQPNTPTEVPPAGPITIKGMVVCLSHLNTDGPQTAECAFGLKADSGLYFGLSDTDPDYKNISSLLMNGRVEIEGIFSPRTDSKYQSVGVIEVTKVTKITEISLGKSGITGVTSLGPICPVVSNPPDPSCTDRPYETRLAITTVDGARVIKEFQTNAAGKFTVEIAPGEYSIRTAAVANVLPYCQSNEEIRVKKDTFTEVVVYCDTGIR